MAAWPAGVRLLSLQLKGFVKHLPSPFLNFPQICLLAYLQLTIYFLTLSHLTFIADIFFPRYFAAQAFVVLDFALGLSARICSLAQIYNINPHAKQVHQFPIVA